MSLSQLSFLFLFSIAFFVQAQEDIRVSFPEGWQVGNAYPGTIESVDIHLKPLGLYTRVDLFLGFSAKGSGWEDENLELEILFDFNLPTGTIIDDAWLWMPDGVIVQAEMYPLANASDIYADLVFQQSVDPLILKEKKYGGYQMRVFPLIGSEPRKLKVSFMMPTEWKENEIVSSLPTDFIATSHSLPEFFRILSFDETEFGQPSMAGLPDVPFTSVLDQEYGLVWMTNLPGDYLTHRLAVQYQNPMVENIYLSSYQTENDNEPGKYQLAVRTDKEEITSAARNIVSIILPPEESASISMRSLEKYIAEEFAENLGPNDLFNALHTTGAYDQWQAINPQSISAEEMALHTLLENSSENTGEFAPALTAGMKYLDENGGSGDLFIFYTNKWEPFMTPGATQNQLLEVVEDGDINVHFVNYLSYNFNWACEWTDISECVDAAIYPSNSFIQGFLSDYPNCTYHTVFYPNLTIWESIQQSIQTLNEQPGAIELDLDLATGISLDEYRPVFSRTSNNPHQAILQIGSYYGTETLEGEVTAYNFYSDEPSFQHLNIPTEGIYLSDPLVGRMHANEIIQSKESAANSQADYDEIIALSMETNVLSKYTALLALDVSVGGEPCPGCDYFGSDFANSLEETEINNKNSLTVFPNPFFEYCQITVTTDDLNDLAIYDLSGRMVYTFDLELVEEKEGNITWDGRDTTGSIVPNGTYIIRAQSISSVQTVKVMLAR